MLQNFLKHFVGTDESTFIQIIKDNSVSGDGSLQPDAASQVAGAQDGDVFNFGHTLNLKHHHPGHRRSEEHTSELQSHSDLVCRLLLEKNKVVRDAIESADRIPSALV